MADPAYVRNFKTFTKGTISQADLPALEAEMYGANDRAAAVMLSSVTEFCLEVFLRRKTRPTFSVDDMRLLFDFRGPLGDFSSNCRRLCLQFIRARYATRSRFDPNVAQRLGTFSTFVRI